MNIRRIPGGWHADALPGGHWCTLVYWDTPDRRLETSQGVVPIPGGALKAALYPRIRLVTGALEICATSEIFDRALTWDGFDWHEHDPIVGTNPCIWGPLGLLVNRYSEGGHKDLTIPDHVASAFLTDLELGSQGFRHINAAGQPVTCDASHNDGHGLFDYTDFGDVAIGQALTDELVVRFKDDGVLRVIDRGIVRFARASRDGDVVALAWVREDLRGSSICETTVEELRACPALTVPTMPALKVEVADRDDYLDHGAYKIWTEKDPEPGDDWADFNPHDWAIRFAFVETERELALANAINYPVITTPALAARAKNLVAIRLGQERDGRTHDEMIEAYRPLSEQLDRPLNIYFDGDPRTKPWPTKIRPYDVVEFPLYAPTVRTTPDQLLATGVAILEWLIGQGQLFVNLASQAFDRAWPDKDHPEPWPPNALANLQSVPSRLWVKFKKILIAVTRFSVGRSGFNVLADGSRVRVGGTAVHKAEMLPWHQAEVAANPDKPNRWPRPSQFSKPIPVPNPPTPPAPGPSPSPIPPIEEPEMPQMNDQELAQYRHDVGLVVEKRYKMSPEKRPVTNYTDAEQRVQEAVDFYRRVAKVDPTATEAVDLTQWFLDGTPRDVIERVVSQQVRLRR